MADSAGGGEGRSAFAAQDRAPESARQERRTRAQVMQTGGHVNSAPLHRAAALGLSGPYGRNMEASESFVALALETENLVVSAAQKFSSQRQTRPGYRPTGRRSTSSAHARTDSSSHG